MASSSSEETSSSSEMNSSSSEKNSSSSWSNKEVVNASELPNTGASNSNQGTTSESITNPLEEIHKIGEILRPKMSSPNTGTELNKRITNPLEILLKFFPKDVKMITTKKGKHMRVYFLGYIALKCNIKTSKFMIEPNTLDKDTIYNLKVLCENIKLYIIQNIKILKKLGFNQKSEIIVTFNIESDEKLLKHIHVKFILMQSSD